jgi:sensor histidine kinase YesM
MRNKDILGFDDRWLLVIGIPFVGLILSSVLFSQTLHEGGRYFFYLCYPVSILYTAAFWLVFRTIIIQLRKVKSLQQNTRRRVTTETILILIAFFALKPILEFISDDLLHLDQNVQQPSPTLELFSALIISFFILAVYEIIYIQKQLERSMLEKEQLSRVNMQTQLEGLKNQIQPHFLFNSLNALAGLIPENPDRAVRYVKKLSDVFRYILDIRNESLIQLREELSFLEA